MMYRNINVFLYFSVFTANLLSINTAVVFSWTSPSIPKLYSNDTNINPLGRPIVASEESFLASLQNIGAILGSIISGIAAEKVGRKKTLTIFSVSFAVSHLILALTKSINMYFVCRLLMGIGAGAVLSVLPSYVGEIAENSNRGMLGSIFGTVGAIGHFISFGIAPLISLPLFSYLQIIPVFIFLVIFIPFVPESPYYYLAKDDNDNASKSLKKLRRHSDVTKELLYLKEVVKESKVNKVNFKDLALPATRNGLLVSCGILVLQQFTGIPIILFYLQPILDASGNIIPSRHVSLAIGLLQIISCTFSGFLIDRIGRKMLLHISSMGCSLSLASLGAYFMMQDWKYDLDNIFWLPCLSLLLFYLVFNIGFGPIPWAICGELFSSNVKSLCVTITAIIGFVVSMTIAACFPFVRDAFGMSGVFFGFSGLAASASIFICLVVPETKGKSFEEIQNALSGKRVSGNGEYFKFEPNGLINE